MSTSSGVTWFVSQSCNRWTGRCLSPGWLPFAGVVMTLWVCPARRWLWPSEVVLRSSPPLYPNEVGCGSRMPLGMWPNSVCPRHPCRKRLAFGFQILMVMMANTSGGSLNRCEMWFTPYAWIDLIDVLDVYCVYTDVIYVSSICVCYGHANWFWCLLQVERPDLSQGGAIAG